MTDFSAPLSGSAQDETRELRPKFNADGLIAAIAQIHSRMADGFGRMDPLDAFEVDMSFHRAISEASHNAPLAETHGAYMARLWRSRFLSARAQHNRVRVLDQHAAILSALSERDAARIGTEIKRHLVAFKDTTEAILSAP